MKTIRIAIAVVMVCFFATGIAFGQSSVNEKASLTNASTIYLDMGAYESKVLAHDSVDDRLVSGDGLGVELAKYTPGGQSSWKQVWDENDTAESIQHQMVYDPTENSVLVATLQEYDRHPMLVGKFDATNGHQIWQGQMYAIALEVWSKYDLALQEGGTSSTLFFLNKADGSIESSFVINGYLGSYPMMKVLGDTLYLFTNSFSAKFLLPSGKLVWQRPTTDFAAYAVRTYGTVDAEGNIYVCASDWNSLTGLVLFAGASYASDGQKTWSKEWYGWADKTVSHNGNSWVNGIAFDESFKVLSIFGGVQQAGTDGSQNNNQSAYLALLKANTGDTLKTDKWDDGTTSVATNWMDGYFDQEHRLVLLGHSYPALNNFIATFDVDSIALGVKQQISRPTSFQLSQNYPNPFNPTTIIRYEVPERTFVTLKIYNTLGQEIKTPVEGQVEGGTHEISFIAGSLPTGTYFYRLTTSNGQTDTKKMLLLK